VSFLCPTFPSSITVAKVVSVRLMPYAIEVCVWLDDRNSTMFLVTCNYISLIKLQEYTHTYSYLWKYSMVSRTIVEYPGSPLDRMRPGCALFGALG
jgi:hypothetical protein